MILLFSFPNMLYTAALLYGAFELTVLLIAGYKIYECFANHAAEPYLYMSQTNIQED